MFCKYITDPNWWLVLFALVGAVVAIVTLMSQTKSFRLTIGADLAMKLDDRFNETSFLSDRAHAAQALKSKENLKDAEDVFDFFDTIGLFVRLKALDPTIAHSLFFHWVNLYWTTGQEYIAGKQQTARLVWNDFEQLYKVTRRVEQKRDPASEDLHLTSERIAEYLDDEIALIPTPNVVVRAEE